VLANQNQKFKVRYIIKSIAEKARAFQKDVVAGRYEQRQKGNS